MCVCVFVVESRICVIDATSCIPNVSYFLFKSCFEQPKQTIKFCGYKRRMKRRTNLTKYQIFMFEMPMYIIKCDLYYSCCTAFFFSYSFSVYLLFNFSRWSRSVALGFWAFEEAILFGTTMENFGAQRAQILHSFLLAIDGVRHWKALELFVYKIDPWIKLSTFIYACLQHE